MIIMKKLCVIVIVLNMFSGNHGYSTYSRTNTKSSIQKQPLHNITIAVDNNDRKDSIILNRFTILPKEIDGCTCYFYLSKKDEEEKKYIFAEDFATPGYASINGKMEKFDLVSFKNNTFYIYSNHIYTLRIDFKKKVDTGSEAFNVEGLLTLTHNNIVIVQKHVIGFYGC
jgi:hypothetical protein